MAVRAKMRCTGRHEQTWGQEKMQGVEVTLQPVYSPDPKTENYSWSQATPSGDVKMTITNPAAFEQFRIGRAYFVDFTPADE